MKLNQLKAGVIISYVTMLLKNAISIAYTPIMLRLLGQSEYGLYQFATKVVGYLGILNFGFGSAYMRFYSRYKVKNDEDGLARLNGMFMIVFLGMSLLAIFGGVILTANISNWFSQTFSPDELYKTKVLMAIMVFNLAISFPISVFNSFISAHERFTFQRCLELARIILNPLIMLPLLLMGYKSITMVVLMTALTVLSGIFSVYYCFVKLKMRISFGRLEFSLFKEIGIFSSFIFLNMIADQINWNLDTFIIGKFLGPISVAVYGLGSMLNVYYMDLSMMMSSVFTPKINKIVAAGQGDGVLTDLFTKVGRLQFSLLALIGSGMVVFGRAFISFYGGAGYEDAYPVAVVLVLATTIPMIQCVGVEIQRAKNLHKFRSYVYLAIALVNGVISIPLCIKYGIFGCAFGTALAMVIGQGLVMNIYYHKNVGIDIIYFWKNILKFAPSFIAPAALGAAIMLFVDTYNVWLFLGFGVLYVVVYCASVWFLGFNGYEKELFLQPVKKLLKKGQV